MGRNVWRFGGAAGQPRGDRGRDAAGERSRSGDVDPDIFAEIGQAEQAPAGDVLACL
ncbi:MAG: hypothetical protein HYR62_07360 [Actinobacteria bacterium]|nr:hypothetical protein [Actinomycetota bacterium]MBI3685994.1 hypothetical protein [Actinomycetota bacterium]